MIINLLGHDKPKTDRQNKLPQRRAHTTRATCGNNTKDIAIKNMKPTSIIRCILSDKTIRSCWES